MAMQLVSIFLSLSIAACHALFVEEDLFAHCDILPGTKPDIKGWVDFRMKAGFAAMDIKLNVSGFEPDYARPMHGMHVHEYGDLSNGCESLGDHWNPDGTPHGDRSYLPFMRHAGDLGNVREDRRGNILDKFTEYLAALSGKYNIIGHGLVIHAHEDLPADPNGFLDAGERLGCCIIAQCDGRHWRP